MKNKTTEPILEAAINGDTERVALSLAQGKLGQKTLDAALGHVVKGGHAKATTLLLKAGANPNSTPISNCLLIQAAEGGELAACRT